MENRYINKIIYIQIQENIYEYYISKDIYLKGYI